MMLKSPIFLRMLSQCNRSNSTTTLKRIQEDGLTLGDFIKSSVGSTALVETQEESEMNFPIDSPLNTNRTTRGSEWTSQLQQQKFYIETYGCQMNSSDSEIVSSILQGAGYLLSDSYRDADVVLLNTCAIRENAEDKVWNRLDVLKSHKNSLRSKKNGNNPLPTVGVLGCMAERLKTKLLEADKLVDLVAGPDAYRDLPNLLKIVRGGKEAVNVQLSLDETYADIAPVRSDPSSPSAFVSIMRGCNNMCSYCIVPFTRGRERSRDMNSILDEIKNLRDQGVKEVVLLGQNVNSYHDKKSVGAMDQGRAYVAAAGFSNLYRSRDQLGYRFADLLDKVSDIDPELRIRFTSPHPKDFPDDVLKLIRQKHNICKSIHMPAQSGSTEVIRKMRRGYSREAYLALVDNIRSQIPGVALSSDFIAGFCGETEADHLETISLLEKICFDQAFMFAYSLRDRTHAAHKMVDDVAEEVKMMRLQEIVDTFGRHVTEKNRIEDTGRLHVMLVEGTSRRSTSDKIQLSGRTDTNKRIIIPEMPIACSVNNFLVNGGKLDSQCIPSTTTQVTPTVGDYVLALVHTAGRNTFLAHPLARTTLQEVTKVIPSDQLGALTHDRSKLVL